MEDLVMAKTLEELKEAIDNIIVENDKGEITATTLNMLLHDMSDTLSELGSSGGGQFDIYCNIVANTDPDTMANYPMIVECTEEQKEINKQVYNKVAAGERCPLVMHMNDMQNCPVLGAKANMSSTCTYMMFVYDIPDELIEEMPVNSTEFLMFMNYGATMFGMNGFLLTNSGEIFVQ